MQMSEPTPRDFDSAGLGRVKESAFLISAQAGLLLLLWRPSWVAWIYGKLKGLNPWCAFDLSHI